MPEHSEFSPGFSTGDLIFTSESSVFTRGDADAPFGVVVNLNDIRSLADGAVVVSLESGMVADLTRAMDLLPGHVYVHSVEVDRATNGEVAQLLRQAVSSADALLTDADAPDVISIIEDAWSQEAGVFTPRINAALSEATYGTVRNGETNLPVRRAATSLFEPESQLMEVYSRAWNPIWDAPRELGSAATLSSIGTAAVAVLGGLRSPRPPWFSTPNSPRCGRPLWFFSVWRWGPSSSA